jgi:hypothetical protein
MAERIYNNPAANRFVEEAEGGLWTVEHYYRRYGSEGPAVRVADEYALIDLIRGTTGKIGWDTLGFGWIVYPIVNDEGTPYNVEED